MIIAYETNHWVYTFTRVSVNNWSLFRQIEQIHNINLLFYLSTQILVGVSQIKLNAKNELVERLYYYYFFKDYV